MIVSPIPATLRAAAPGLAIRFAAILAGLRAAVARHLLRDPRLVLIIIPLCSRLGRITRRFERLMARIAAGRLPIARSGGSGRTGPKPKIPTEHGWLVRALRHHGAACGSQLQYLLAEPGMDELLAATPAAARILRPLCHMLGLPDPAPPPAPPAEPSPAKRGRAGWGRPAPLPPPAEPQAEIPPPPQMVPPPCPRVRWPWTYRVVSDPA